jgi:hypothetical protein
MAVLVLPISEAVVEIKVRNTYYGDYLIEADKL